MALMGGPLLTSWLIMGPMNLVFSRDEPFVCIDDSSVYSNIREETCIQTSSVFVVLPVDMTFMHHW